MEALEDRCTPSAIWFVNDDASGANTGTSWADAFTALGPALVAAQPGEEVWVARGTYADAAPFALRDGVAVYGGFAGTEQTLSQRDFRRNVTTLSGRDAHTVVTADGLGSGLLDGFTVTAGMPAFPGNRGGGVHVRSGALALANLSITNNRATEGGGVYNSGTVALTDVAFSDNTTAGSGAGMVNEGTATLTNVSFRNNRAAGAGGGLHSTGGAATLTNVTFLFNFAPAGGALAGVGVTLTNVTSTRNGAGRNQGAFNVTNATFTNCVLWGDNPSEINPGPGVTVRYSDVQGGISGTGNIDADPLFVDSTSGNLRLRAGSPAIDAGTNAGAPTFDLDHNHRPVNATGQPTAITDMGAYEFQTRPLPLVAVGTREGVPGYVALYNAAGQRFTLQPYGDFTGGVRVAVADFDLDGVEDLVTAPGPGGSPTVKVYSGRNAAVLAAFDAYGSSFTGGAYVAAADVLGLGAPQVVTGPGAGGAPFVQLWELRGGPGLAASLQAFDAAFTGGVTVGASTRVLVAGAASQGMAVRVFDQPNLSRSWMFEPFGQPFVGGVTVATNGRHLAVGQVAGTSLVNVFNLSDLSLATTIVPKFGIPHAEGATGGTSVAWTREADGTFNLLTGTGPGWPAEVQYWVAGSWHRRTGFFDFGGYPGGIWVA